MNISFYLHEHSWSTCWINANDKFYKISITHIFPEDPIGGCLISLMGIMRGEKEREFLWYGEPGGERIKIEEIPTNYHWKKVYDAYGEAGFSETKSPADKKYKDLEEEKRFAREVFALVNRQSHSQSAVTAAQIQDYTFGTIVGEETGGLSIAVRISISVRTP